MPDTTRRVALTLIIATDDNASEVLYSALAAVRDECGFDVQSTTTSAFDLTDPDEPSVQIVVDPVAGITGAWVDNPDRADEFARNTGGVVLALPIEADHRSPKESR